MILDDRLYTSTEVAEILGVSLRSVYRYLEEGKLIAEVKTATGRLRFTRQNILDFLHPQETRQLVGAPKDKRDEEKKEEVVKAESKSQKPSAVAEDADTEEESIDWLERFRGSASKFGGQKVAAAPKPEPVSEPEPEPVESAEPEEFVQDVSVTSEDLEEVSELADSSAEITPKLYYYRSLVGGLKEIAQSVDKVARKADVSYAFTLNAGVSLHKPLKDPFSVLHVYIRSKDREFFEKMLQLVGSNEVNAQLCLLVSDDDFLFSSRDELHGLFVVSREQLKKDAVVAGRDDLLKELD